MPSYDFLCDKCGETQEAILKISELEEKSPLCCGVKTRQVILSAPMVDSYFLGSTKNEGYRCPVTDKFITSKRERLNMMAEHNVVPKE